LNDVEITSVPLHRCSAIKLRELLHVFMLIQLSLYTRLITLAKGEFLSELALALARGKELRSTP
jgi:hypothetical protein